MGSQNLHPSLEAMEFQVNTPLAKKITELHQKVIDYRAEVEKKSHNFREIYNKVFDYYGKHCFNQVLTAINDLTGITVYNGHASSRLGEFCFCTLMMVGKNIGVADVGKAISAGTEKGNIRHPVSFKELQVIANSFNKSTGVIDPSVRKAVKDSVIAEYWFDFPLAFFFDIMTGRNVRAFTARELTAIILHEVGHTMTLVEHAADQYSRMRSYQTSVTEFVKNASVKEQMKVLETAKKLVNENKMLAPKGFPEAVDGLVKAASELSPEYEATFAQNISQTVFFAAMGMQGGTSPLRNFISAFRIPMSGNDQKKKFGDLITTESDYYKLEVLSDQYSSRHGYGEDLASGMDLLYRGYTASGNFGNSTKEAALTGTMKTLLGLSAVISWIFSLPMGGVSVYPEEYERLLLIGRDAIRGMKENGASDAVIANCMRTYEAVVARVKTRPEFFKQLEFSVKFSRMLFYYASIHGIADMIIDGHIRAELETLYRQLDKLVDNPLYYIGTKFKSLT